MKCKCLRGFENFGKRVIFRLIGSGGVFDKKVPRSSKYAQKRYKCRCQKAFVDQKSASSRKDLYPEKPTISKKRPRLEV